MNKYFKSGATLTAMALVLGLTHMQPALAGTADELRLMRQQMAEMAKRMVLLEAKLTETAKQAEETAERMPQAAPHRVVTSGIDGVKLSISGQVNRGVLFADNGDDSEVFFVDNDNSSTRIRFIGQGQLTEDFSVGTQIEVQFESNSTASISFDQSGPAGPNNFTERKLEIYFDSKRFGRLWLGQGDTASNGTSEVDLSGTSVIAYSGIADMAGGLGFSDGGMLGPSIGDVFNQFDGLSRDDRVRYDTPSFSGLKGSVSFIDGDRWDLAGRFSGEFASTKVAAAIAYANADSRGDFEQFNGSLSVLTPFGISVTGAGGTRDTEGRDDDAWFWYAKLGYTFDALELGSTSVALDFTEAYDIDADGDDSRSYGVFLVQKVDKIGTDFYIGVRNHELDRPGANFHDVFTILSGARVKF